MHGPRLALGFLLAFLGIAYLFHPRFILRMNAFMRESVFRDSYVLLNSILERLENKRRRLEGFNPVGVFIKRIKERI